MKTFYGNYLGIVVNGKDPEQRGRCQVFIPHIMPSLDEGWRGEDRKIVLTGNNLENSLSYDEILQLRKLLPWAECAAPIIGAGPAGHLLEGSGEFSSAALNTGAGASGADVGDGYASDPGPVTGKLAGIQEKNADFAARLNGFQKEAGQNGINVEIVSGVRSTERQAQIKAQAIARGRSTFAAPAGGSYHEYGLAADIRATGNGVSIGLGSTRDVSTPLFKELLVKYGLHRPLLNYANAPEPWHVEPSYTPTAGLGQRGAWLENYKQFGYGGIAKPDVNPTFSPLSFTNFGQQMSRDNQVVPNYVNKSASSFTVINQTRDEISPGTDGPASIPGDRIVSLDFDGRPGGEKFANQGAYIVIPNDASEQEIQAAESYIKGVVNFMRSNGLPNYKAFSGNIINGKFREGVATTGQNGGGKKGYFHTEPFTKQDTAAFNAIKNNPAGYMSVVTSTLGSNVPGARIIAPHTTSKQGAASNGYSETRFAKEILIPAAGQVAFQGIPGAGQTSGGVSFGGGNATRFLNKVGSATGQGGFNPNLPNIGVFPWALSKLGQQRPDLIEQGYLRVVTNTSDPYYVNSKWSPDKGPLYTVKKPLYAQFSYNGQTYGALINDVGSAFGQQTVEGSSRLFDISEVGSLPGLLGLTPITRDGESGQNLTGISDFTIAGAYTDQPLGVVGSGQEIYASSSLPIVNERPFAIAPGPDTNYIPTGMFGSAREGQLVWCFFQEGNPLFPVYFAASYGREEWQNISQATSPSVGNGIDDTWAVNWKTEAGGLRFVQTRENAEAGLEDDYISEFYGQYGGTLRFKKEGSEFFQPFHHGQQIEGNFYDVTVANREQKTGGTDNRLIEGDSYVTIGDWSQEALEAAAERQKIINEAMKLKASS